jgi:uncharacterized membrane protein (UPF0127 family)
MRPFACAAALCATLITCSCHAAMAVVTLRLQGHPFSAEVASDDLSRAQGLMNRDQLAPDSGMLFVFRHSEQRWFWMKNTLIPLDILFFDNSRKLVSMQTDVPPCRQDPCPTYPSGQPARYVLELAAGTAARIGAHAGDQLSIEGDVGPVH